MKRFSSFLSEIHSTDFANTINTMNQCEEELEKANTKIKISQNKNKKKGSMFSKRSTKVRNHDEIEAMIKDIRDN
jgi:predicted DNA-binding protein YlxM (UPF0122 family)